MRQVDREELLAHSEFVRALARRLVLDPNRADDVAQETMLAALRNPPQQRGPLRRWLGRVARNIAYRTFRDDERRLRREAQRARPDRVQAAGDVVADLQLHREVVDALLELDEPYRTTLILHFFEGMPPRAIATRTNRNGATVRSHLKRGIERLRCVLDERHGGNREAWCLALLSIAFPAKTAGAATATTVAEGVLFTMKKAVVLILLGVAAVFLVWSNSRRDMQPAPFRAPVANSPTVAGTDPEQPSSDDAVVPDGEAPSNGFAFSGRVVDPQGAGVAGAHVALLFVSSIPDVQRRVVVHQQVMLDEVLRREAERFEGPATTTDAAGRFRITRRSSSSSCLRVTADGFAPAFAGPVSPGAFTTIRVRARNAVLVRVRGPDGRPLAGADVRVQTLGLPGEARRVLAEARTDASGEARVPDAGDHRFLLVVDPNRHDLGYLERGYDHTDRMIEVTVPRVDVRTVLLLDATTRTPLPDGYIIIGSSGGTPMWDQEIARRRFHADANGVVRYPIQAGYYGRFVTAPGYEILTVDRDVMPLRRSMRIDGVVRDPAGQPVAGAPVVVAGLQNVFERVYLALPFVSAWTGDDGRFSLEIKMLTGAYYAVPDPGTRSLIALVAPHAPAIEDNVAVQPGGQIEVELRAPPAARVTVILTRREDGPVPDKRVQFRRFMPRAATWADVQPDYGVDILSLKGGTPKKTDANGRIELAPLAPGDYLMWMQHTRRTVTVRAGEHKVIEIVWGAGDAVFGRVLDSAGEPVVGINVGLGGKSQWVLQTDKEGRFRFDEVERGEYFVTVWGGGKQARTRMPVKLNDENTIRLPAGAARLRILASGPAANELEFTVTPEHGFSVPPGPGFLAVEKGGLTCDIPPGRGILIIRAKGWGWKPVAYEATANDTTEIRVEMRRAGSVSGRLEEIPDANHVMIQFTPESLPRLKGKLGELLAAAIRRTLGQASRNVKPNADGRFTSEDLSPGTYRARLLVWNATDRKWTETANVSVTVEAGTAATISFDGRR